MAWVNTVAAQYYDQNGNNYAVTFTGAHAGNMLVITMMIRTPSIALTSINVSGETDATLISATSLNYNSVGFIMAYHPLLTASGNKTVTFNFASNPTESWPGIMEFSGQAAAGTLLDAAKTATNASEGWSQPADCTTTLPVDTAGELIVLAYGGTAFATLPRSGWVIPSGHVHWNTGDADSYTLDAGAAGTKTVGVTKADTVSSATWSIVTASFRPGALVAPSVQLGAFDTPDLGQPEPAFRQRLQVGAFA